MANGITRVLVKGQQYHPSIAGFRDKARRGFSEAPETDDYTTERMPRNDVETSDYNRYYPGTTDKDGVNRPMPLTETEGGFEDPVSNRQLLTSSHKVAPQFDFSSTKDLEPLEGVLPDKLMTTVRSLMRFASKRPDNFDTASQGARTFQPERMAQKLVSNYLSQQRPDILAMEGVDWGMGHDPEERGVGPFSRGNPKFYAQTNPYDAEHYETRLPPRAYPADEHLGGTPTFDGAMGPFGEKTQEGQYPMLRFLSDGTRMPKKASEPMDLAWRLLKSTLPIRPRDTPKAVTNPKVESRVGTPPGRARSLREKMMDDFRARESDAGPHGPLGDGERDIMDVPL